MEGPLKEARGKVLEVKGNRATLHLKSLGMNIIAKLAVQSLKKTRQWIAFAAKSLNVKAYIV